MHHQQPRQTASLNLFGGFQLFSGDALPLPAVPRKAQILLTRLALAPDFTLSRERLSRLLWGEGSTSHLRNSLRQLLFSIRQGLGTASDQFLVATSDTVGLSGEGLDIDVILFRRLTMSGGAADNRAAARLYRGDLLDNINFFGEPSEPWILGERERLRETALRTLQQVLVADVQCGNVDQSIATCLQLLSLDLLDEATHRTLMCLYADQQRWGAADRQYQICCSVLNRHLGAKPQPATLGLYQDIVGRRQRHALTQLDLAIRQEPPAVRHGDARLISSLVIEDHAPTRKLVERVLLGLGFDVLSVEDGASGVFELGRRAFDLVVSSSQAPGVSGFDLLRFLRRKNIDLPVVLLTRKGDRDEQLSLALGAADFIRRPVREDILQTRLGGFARIASQKYA